MIDDRTFALLCGAVELLERMDPSNLRGRPAATDAEYDALLTKLQTFVDEEWHQRLIQSLSDIYAPHEAREWMNIPNELLGGHTAAELIALGRGTEVEAIVLQLRDSAHL